MERSGISELAPVDPDSYRDYAGLRGDLAMGIKSLEWFLMVKKSGFLEGILMAVHDCNLFLSLLLRCLLFFECLNIIWPMVSPCSYELYFRFLHVR